MAKSSTPVSAHFLKKSGGNTPPVLAIVLVVVIVGLVHWPVLSARAISIDDQQYLIENPLVQSPGWNSIRRFFGEVLAPSTVEGYYHPLSMISLMVDVALGGSPDNLAPFRRTNLLLHLANAALLLVILRSLFTGTAGFANTRSESKTAAARPTHPRPTNNSIMPAAMLAVLILALHPLAVEPVAWISERKTLLAAFFSLLSMLTYLRFVQHRRTGSLVSSLLCYLAALLSKPTSLPLPIVLLLLDWWPLGRISRHAIIEKTPFFLAAMAMGTITFLSQGNTAIAELPGSTSPLRIPLIITHNIGFYITQFLWPVAVSGHYIFPPTLSLAEPAVLRGVIISATLLLVLLYSLRATRALFACFLMSCVMLLPTLQLVGFTDVIAADKYLYLPSIGVAILLCHGLDWLISRWTGVQRSLVIAAVALVLIIESTGARFALAHWSDTEKLYTHMLEIAPHDARVHSYLALHYARTGRPDDALKQCEAAIQEPPADDFSPVNVGVVLIQLGRSQTAAKYYEDALKRFPESAILHANLCAVLINEGRAEEAIQHGKRAVELKPRLMEAHYHLANALAAAGQFEEAVKEYEAGLDLRPDSAEIRHNLGVAYFQLDQADRAVAELKKAAALKPTWADPHQTLARVYASQGQFANALKSCQTALSLDSKNPLNHVLMGDILMDLDRPGDARGVFQHALSLSPGLPGAERGMARAEEALKDVAPAGKP